jgi:hypothetical protein
MRCIRGASRAGRQFLFRSWLWRVPLSFCRQAGDGPVEPVELRTGGGQPILYGQAMSCPSVYTQIGRCLRECLVLCCYGLLPLPQMRKQATSVIIVAHQDEALDESTQAAICAVQAGNPLGECLLACLGDTIQLAWGAIWPGYDFYRDLPLFEQGMQGRIDRAKAWTANQPAKAFHHLPDIVSRHGLLAKQAEYEVAEALGSGGHRLVRYISVKYIIPCGDDVVKHIESDLVVRWEMRVAQVPE